MIEESVKKKMACLCARDRRRYEKIRNDWRIDKARLGLANRPAGD